MNWLNQDVRTSLMSLLKFAEPMPKNTEDRLESIREKMLSEMGEFGETKFPRIMRRVRYAEDAQGLWYARGDTMAVLSVLYGETIARQKMASISQEFVGMLPAGLNTRPSSLTAQ